jgi:hypothetical protein
MNFAGNPTAMTSQALSNAAIQLSVKAPEIWTVFAVETSGCGFLSDRRPQILYERHIFWECTNGKFTDAPDISNATPGGYGEGGSAQYARLSKALALDKDAALKSTSWGLGQILGQNFKEAGFANVDAMVAAMILSEDAHLLAFAKFLQSKGLDKDLQAHNWVALARGYNGPNYAKYQYDTKLRANYMKYSSGALPDLTLRAAQLYLTFLGYQPGPVDGMGGRHTEDAIGRFQQDAQLPVTGTLDAQTEEQLTQKATTAQQAAVAGD